MLLMFLCCFGLGGLFFNALNERETQIQLQLTPVATLTSSAETLTEFPVEVTRIVEIPLEVTRIIEIQKEEGQSFFGEQNGNTAEWIGLIIAFFSLIIATVGWLNKQSKR